MYEKVLLYLLVEILVLSANSAVRQATQTNGFDNKLIACVYFP